MATTRSGADAGATTAPANGEQDKAKKEEERKATAKRAVKHACDELHAMRPQPRADEIEAVLDQIRNSEDPPKDAEGAKAAAKQLYDKSHPKSEDASGASKPVGAQSGTSASSGASASA